MPSISSVAVAFTEGPAPIHRRFCSDVHTAAGDVLVQQRWELPCPRPIYGAIGRHAQQPTSQGSIETPRMPSGLEAKPPPVRMLDDPGSRGKRLHGLGPRCS